MSSQQTQGVVTLDRSDHPPTLTDYYRADGVRMGYDPYCKSAQYLQISINWLRWSHPLTHPRVFTPPGPLSTAPELRAKYGAPGATDRDGFDPYADSVGPGIYGGNVVRDAKGEIVIGEQYQNHNPRPGEVDRHTRLDLMGGPTKKLNRIETYQNPPPPKLRLRWSNKHNQGPCMRGAATRRSWRRSRWGRRP